MKSGVLLPPVRVARRHAARVGDERYHRGDDRSDGAGDHDLHRFPPFAPLFGRRREPSAIAPPTHAAVPAAHAPGTSQDQSPVWGRPPGVVPGAVPGRALSAIVAACTSAVSSTTKGTSSASS